MRIVVTAEGNDLDAAVGLDFDRCATHIFVELPDLKFEVLGNPAAGGGAELSPRRRSLRSIEGCRLFSRGRSAQHAYDTLQKAGVPVLLVQEGTVRQAITAYESGALQHLMGPNSADSDARPALYPADIPALPGPDSSTGGQEQELAMLKSLASDLQRRVAELLARIEQLEKRY